MIMSQLYRGPGMKAATVVNTSEPLLLRSNRKIDDAVRQAYN